MFIAFAECPFKCLGETFICNSMADSCSSSGSGDANKDSRIRSLEEKVSQLQKLVLAKPLSTISTIQGFPRGKLYCFFIII